MRPRLARICVAPEVGVGCADVIDEGYETRRCLLAIARAYFDLGEYHQSRIHIERLLKRDPNNAQALELHRQIREVVSKGASCSACRARPHPSPAARLPTPPPDCAPC